MGGCVIARGANEPYSTESTDYHAMSYLNAGVVSIAKDIPLNS